MNPEIFPLNNNIVIITIIICAVLTGIVIYWEWYHVELGCTPIQSERYSIPTRWKCP